MQLKHRTLKFAIPAEPDTLELRLGRRSRRLRFGRCGERLREGFVAVGLRSNVEGEEIDGGGGGQGALGSVD